MQHKQVACLTVDFPFCGLDVSTAASRAVAARNSSLSRSKIPCVAIEADILLVTVNQTETNALLEAFKGLTATGPILRQVEDRSYLDLGEVRSQRIWHMTCQMGAIGVGGSLQDISKAINTLSPRAVIMVGVAMGTDKKKQKIGDVLVSRKITMYEPRRVGSRNVLRGDRTSSSAFLLSRCQSATSVWKPDPAVEVQFGPFLTGEKLVDDKRLRADLLSDEPEAIGVEMEGAGLYVACVDAGVPWIMAKGICDWGDGKKSFRKTSRQKLAAKNAATYVAHILGIFPPLFAPVVEQLPGAAIAHLYWLGSDLADGVRFAKDGAPLAAVRETLTQAHWHFRSAPLNHGSITDTMESTANALGKITDPRWYENSAVHQHVFDEMVRVKGLVNVHIDTLGGDKFKSHPPEAKKTV